MHKETLTCRRRHVVFASSSTDSYAGDTFGALVDLLAAENWDVPAVKKQVSIIVYLTQAAANSLSFDLNTRGV